MDHPSRPDRDTELARLGRQRRRVHAELASAALVLAALFAVAPRVDGPRAEGHALFAIAGALFAVALVRLVSRVGRALGAACPRCARAFHGDGWQLLGALPLLPAACVHCGLGLASRRDPDRPPDRSGEPAA